MDKVLIKHLESKGLEGNALLRMIKDMMLAFSMNPLINSHEINNRLQVLGWDDIELDYRTWELAKESFERQESYNNRNDN